MTRPKKFPTILLIFTLVSAILVAGITKPGFLLALLRPNIAEPKGSDADISQHTYMEGNSRAFNITADTGFTVSAEKNALDHDRTFNISRLAEDVIQSFREIAFRADDLDVMPVIGWDVDAGMTADDIMPGEFRMDFDLSQLGIPSELYESAAVYHIDEDGLWDQFRSTLNGSVLSVEANHNGPILVGILTWTALITAFKLGYDNIVDWNGRAVAVDTYPVYEYDEVVRTVNNGNGDVPEIKHYGSQLFTLKFTLSDRIKECQNELRQLSKQITDECMAESEESMIRDYGANYMNSPSLRYPLVEKFNRMYTLYKQRTGVGSEYRRVYSEMTGLLKAGGNYSWNSIRSMARLVRTAYYYLDKVAKVKTPKYCPTIFMNPAITNHQTQTYLYTGRAFSILDTSAVGSDKDIDCNLLITITHEMFHMCQREYCAKSRASSKYDEATAQLLEEYAYEYYKGHTLNISVSDSGTVSAEFAEASEADSLSPKKPDFGNGYQLNYMACQMNGTYYYTLLRSDSFLFDWGKAGDSASTGYVYARFLDYLWKDYEKYDERKMTWDKILSAYRWYNVNPDLSTMFKQAFGYWEHDLTRKFKYFAEESKELFYKYGLTSKGKYYSPTVGSTTQNGKGTRLYNQYYTIKTRYFEVYSPENYNKQASLLLVQDKNFKSQNPDVTLIPVGNTRCEPCKHGLFYTPQSVADLKKGAILEVDGGTSGDGAEIMKPIDELMGSGYSLWTLLAPDEITPEIKDGQLRFTMPEKSDAAKKDLIDGYRVTITASTSPAEPLIEHYTTGIAGQERTINLDKLIPESLIRRAEEDESGDTVSFTVSVCEYIKDEDGKIHYGPESNPRSSMNALLAEMGAHEGRITITLHWYGTDDLDLHCITPQGGHIYYSNKEADGGYLDVDMNINGDRTESVEHIYFDQPDAGDYKVYVVNFTDRTEGDHNAEIYISVEGRQIIADTSSMGGRSKTWKFRTTSAVLAETGGQYLVAEPLGSTDPPA